MRRIYPKNNGTGNFRFGKKTSEVSASPIGAPKQIEFHERYQTEFRFNLLKKAPKNADAFLVGEKKRYLQGYTGTVAVQYYKIRTVHTGGKKSDHQAK